MSIHTFEDEVFLSIRRSRAIAWRIAVAAGATAMLSVGAVAALAPLKETQPYVVLVDRATGEAEKLARVAPLDLAEADAVRQAELVRYVTDRETYDVADNEARMRSVYRQSTESAAETWRRLWARGNPGHPATVYGDETRITVTVKSVSFLNDATAQLRLVKRRAAPGASPVEAAFVATVGFSFRPRVERTLEQVWENPLGFVVSSYRLDAETLQGDF